MIRYRKLGYVELIVTDLERSAAFYRDIVGLEPAGEGPEGERRFRCSEDPYAVVLHQADQPGFRRGGWMLEDERQFLAVDIWRYAGSPNRIDVRAPPCRDRACRPLMAGSSRPR